MSKKTIVGIKDSAGVILTCKDDVKKSPVIIQCTPDSEKHKDQDASIEQNNTNTPQR